MALRLIPREGLVVLQKKRLEHLKETENTNGRFWPKCVRSVASACVRDVPGSPLGKLLEDYVKLKKAYFTAIAAAKLANDEPELLRRHVCSSTFSPHRQILPPNHTLRATFSTSRLGAPCILAGLRSLPSC